MNFRDRCKKIYGENRKVFRLLLIIELCLFLGGVVGLFGKDTVYEFGTEAMINGTEDDDFYAAFDRIAVPRGTYQVSLLYDTDTNMMNSCEVLVV